VGPARFSKAVERPLRLLLLSALLASAGARAQVSPSQRDALLDLYQATNGDSWSDRTGWLGAPGTECQWIGVSCDQGKGSVVGIDLSGNNLVGGLPQTIRNLSSLRTLRLSSNSLVGTLPGALVDLGDLEVLAVAHNGFSGEIPPAVGTLPFLSTLDLEDNDFTGPIPAFLANMKKLSILHLGHNHFSGPLPAFLGTLTELHDLHVDSNQLTGPIPNSLMALTSLAEDFTGLRIDYNGLYTSDPALRAFLDLQNPNWHSTQTVAPSDLQVADATKSTLTLRWSPIEYIDDGGFYQGFISVTPGGPYSLLGRTSNKAGTSLIATGLAQGATYYFIVITLTSAHSQNDNVVVSDPSPEVHGTTLSDFPTAFVTGSGTICAGQPRQISAALTGNPPWTLNWSDGVLQSGLTSSPAVRTVAPAVTTTYSLLSVSDPRGAGTVSGSAVVTVNPAPAPVISALSELSPAQAATASVESHAGSSYLWTVGNATLTTPATGSAISFVAGTAGAVTLTIVETSAAGCASTPATRSIPILAPCPAPGAPLLGSPAGTYLSGQSALVTWSAAAGLDSGGTYLLETSRDSFATVESSRVVTGRAALLSSDVGVAVTTLSVRVRARQGCGASGPASAPLVLAFRPAPASFLFTREGPSWVARPGDDAPVAEVSFRNVGALAGRLTLSASGGFFTISASTLDLAAGQEGLVTLRASAAALAHAGSFAGALTARADGGQLVTPVFLTVAPDASERLTASAGSVLFVNPAGGNPAAQQLRLGVSAGGTQPVFVAQQVSPGGAWLRVEGLETPIAPGGERTLTLRVDRSLRSLSEGPAPLRTLLRLTPAGGDPATDSAFVEVVDVESVAVEPGAGRGAPETPSFLVPVAVKAVSGVTGQRFTSDGWLRNVTGAPVVATLFFTPDGADGLTDARVLRARLEVPPASTLRLADLLGSVFGVDGTSGQIEVRSATPQALSLRTTVDSLLPGGGAESRFGTEIPTVSTGAGVGAGGGELALPGIDDDAANRANLILAETAGASTLVRVTLFGSGGDVLAVREYAVPPYGKVQETRIVDKLLPGRSLSGGWLAVRVLGGAGRVVALATVIDNSSGSFSAVLGSGGASSGGTLFPSVARTVGLNQTLFRTRLDLANRSDRPALLSLAYLYTDQDDGNRAKRVDRTVVLPPRGALAKDVAADVIVTLFGVSGRSFGSILVEGETAGVAGVAGVSSQVDPADATKGFKTAQVNGVPLESAAFLVRGDEPRRVPNAEKSDARRTNVILLETSGKPCLVELRATSSAGQPMGSRVFDVGPGAYRQINQAELFGADGLALGEGTFQNVELTARVVEGDGRVAAIATVIDNLARNPEIFLFQPAGPPAP